MPKVNEEYFENKRKIILEAALRVFLKKPAYSVNMKDIVKESQLSQGGVYKYYSNIDDVVISLLNSKEININPKEILDKYDDEPEKAIFELLRYFKNFFFANHKEFGKIFFELQAMFLNDENRIKRYKENIKKELALNYWFSELFRYIDKKIEEKYFNPITDPNDIYMQIIVTAGGIGTELILNKYYNIDRILYYFRGENKESLKLKLDSIIDSLYKTILFLLNSKNINKYSFIEQKNCISEQN